MCDFSTGQIVKLKYRMEPFSAHDLLQVTAPVNERDKIGVTDGQHTGWVDVEDLELTTIARDQRLPLPMAQHLAVEAARLLEPACERIAIAGSIRRQAEDAGDIEIVCMPKLHYPRDLFGGFGDSFQSELDALCAELIDSQMLDYRLDKQGRRAWGSKYKRALLNVGSTAFALDIFAVIPPAQWGVIYTIRTGPGDFSKLLVTDRRHGGGTPSHMRVKDGALLDGRGNIIETPEEAHFFAALGLPYIPARERTAQRLADEIHWATGASLAARAV